MSNVDPRLVEEIKNINKHLADRSIEYRYTVEMPGKGLYQIKAIDGCPWYYPPTYGQESHKVAMSLRMLENIKRFEIIY